MCSLGRSVEGRQLLGLKITAGARGERPLLRPQVKFSASLHGDEAVSRELLIGLARSAAGGLVDCISILSVAVQGAVRAARV